MGNDGQMQEGNGDMVPQGWDSVALGDIAEIRYGKAKLKGDGEVPVIGSGGIYGWTTEPLANPPSIIVGRKGTAGSVWLVEDPCWPSDTTFYVLPYESVDVHFLYYYMSLNKLSGEHAKTTLPSIQKQELENMKIGVPSLPEQRAIARVLMTIQKAKEATEKVIAAMKELKKSLMRYLFTYGPCPIDEAERVPLKETEIGRVPDHWDVRPFGDFATLQRGKDLPVKQRRAGIFPVVGSNGILGYHSEYVARGPGITVGRSGSVGEAVYIETDYWPLNTTLWVKDTHGNNAKYIYYFCDGFDFSRYAAGVSVPTLNRNLVHPVNIGVPPLHEQRRIAEILEAIDIKLDNEERGIRALSSLFATALYQLMKGQIRVMDLEV